MKRLMALSFLLVACVHPNAIRQINSEKSSGLSPAEVDALWERVNDKKDSLIRSNPSHYWAWMKNNTPADLTEIVDFTGVVTADPHYFNFGDIHSDKKGGLALVDIDDSGEASYYLDFIRYALFVKAYTKNDYTEILFKNYEDGLQRKDKKTPSVLKDAIKTPREKIILAYDKWVAENLNSDYTLINKKNDLSALKNTTSDQEKLGQTLKEQLLQQRRAEKIYDVGYKQNDSGSSRGLGRYWFSIAQNNKIKVIECKQLSRPATDYYGPQDNQQKRVSDVLKYYSDFKTDDSYVFSTADTSFWCRPKHFQSLERSDIENLDREKLIELSSYFAYWMGFKQSAQKNTKDYLRVLSQKKGVVKSTIKLISDYEDHVFQLK